MRSPFREEHEDYAALLRLRNVRGTCGIVEKRASRIITNPVVEDARDNEDFFRTGSVNVQSRESRASIDFKNLGFGAVLSLPQKASTNSRKYFSDGSILPICCNHAFQIGDHCRLPLLLLRI